MEKYLLIFLSTILIAPIVVSAVDSRIVEVKPIDCGPLDRDEFGVVFSAFENKERRTYFVKGRAHILCPEIMQADVVEGEIHDLCRNYTPPDPNECNGIKEFILKKD